MAFLDVIWEWIKTEADAWFWIVVGSLFLFGMAVLSDGLDWITKKLWRVED